jgi:biotin carboxyl carrier protein
MKMQNVLKSSRKGIIKSCRAKVGASLKADEIVIEFEKATELHKK